MIEEGDGSATCRVGLDDLWDIIGITDECKVRNKALTSAMVSRIQTDASSPVWTL